jgi:hypothetical protein
VSRRGAGLIAYVETWLLTLWLGAALFFAAVVAPAAFAVLPSSTLAGALVGRVLPVLFATGGAVGILILALELRWRRAGSRLRLSAAGVMLAACAGAQFVVGGQIARLRAGAPMATLERTDPRRVAFGRLHALSIAALAAAMVAAAAAAAGSRRSPTAGS